MKSAVGGEGEGKERRGRGRGSVWEGGLVYWARKEREGQTVEVGRNGSSGHALTEEK